MQECDDLVEEGKFPWRWGDIYTKLDSAGTSIVGLDQALNVRATSLNMIMIVNVSSLPQGTETLLQGRRTLLDEAQRNSTKDASVATGPGWFTTRFCAVVVVDGDISRACKARIGLYPLMSLHEMDVILQSGRNFIANRVLQRLVIPGRDHNCVGRFSYRVADVKQAL